MNYKILVQYDGTRYEGWQRQERTESTIQGKIEAVLSKMCGEEVQIQGAGRTDAGVHAKEQVANVHLKEQVDPQEVKQYLNRYLPEDIAVTEVRAASERFHSRLNVVKKTYVYRIWNADYPNVFERKYMLHDNRPMDVEAMRQAAQYLLGKHDFAAFCGNAKMKKSTVRTIHEIDIRWIGEEIRFTYTGNGFLQNMIRILTGTLVNVGCGVYPPEQVAEILASKIRAEAGPTMPAQGLTLWEVIY